MIGLLLAFPQAKGWDSAGDLPERWSLVKPGIASLIFNDHLHPPRIGRKVVGWERCRIQTMSFLSAPRRATNSLYFSLLYWWPLLVVSWSSNGHQAVTVTWSSCLYRVLMLIFFTLPAMFFFRPSTYYDLLQWVSTCLNCREQKSPKLLPPAVVAQRQVDPHRGHPAAIRQTSVPGPCRFGLAQVRIQFHGQVHGTKIYHILYHHGWLNGCISTIMDDLMVP